MKLRYYRLIDCLLCVILILAIFFILEIFLIHTKDINLLCVTLAPTIIMLLICSIDIILDKNYLKNAKEKGEKKLGYIIDSFYIRRHFTISKIIPYEKCAFKCIVDGEIKDIIGIYGISDDDAYEYVCQELKKLKETSNDNTEIKNFPIDVYVYKNKYYFDLASVNLDKKSLQ